LETAAYLGRKKLKSVRKLKIKKTSWKKRGKQWYWWQKEKIISIQGQKKILIRND